MLCLSGPAFAYDFEADGYYFNITDKTNKEVEVSRSPMYNYSGVANIPEKVNYNENVYTVTAIGQDAFWSCENLLSVTIPNTVTEIRGGAFFDCINLRSVTMGAAVTSIGKNAFSILLSAGYYNFTIPKVIWLCNTPPKGVGNLSGAINYVSNNQFNLFNQKVYPFLSSKFEVDGVVYVPVSPSDRTCDVIDCNYAPTSTEIKIDEVVVKKGVELKVLDINDYSFYKNDKITSLSANNNGNIGGKAFYNCDALTSVEANNIGYIGDNAFTGCHSLKNLSLGDAITTIGVGAFKDCSSLPTVSVPDNISSIGGGIFLGCSALEAITIGRGLSTIPNSAFNNCKALKSISIPNNINSIVNNVFEGCIKLGDISFEDFGESAMNSKPIELGYNYYNKENQPLFSDCPLDEVYIGRKLSYSTDADDGYSPFYRNTSLRSVKITDAETEIYDNEFYGCSNLQEFSCGDGVESIGKWAFSGCSAMKSYASGSNVKTIGDEAFSDCTGLTSFSTSAAVPPTCGNQALDDINKWECVLHVPSASVDDYKAAEQWKEFFFVEPTSGIENVAVDGAQVKVTVEKGGFSFGGEAERNVEVYSIDGQLQYSATVHPGETVSLPDGLYIVRIGTQTVKVRI